MTRNSLFVTVFFFIFSTLFLFFPVAAQQDSVRLIIKPKHAIVPVSLVASGLITQGRMSRYFREEFKQRYHGSYGSKAEDYIPFAPGVISLGLAASGVKGRHSFKEQLILAIVSNVIAQGVTQGLKILIHYPRPDGNGHDSFPSGHTTAAFANATLLHEEYGHRSALYSIGGYGVATAAGVMRIASDRHWVSDVLVGAGAGIGATKAVYLTYPWLKRQVRKRK